MWERAGIHFAKIGGRSDAVSKRLEIIWYEFPLRVRQCLRRVPQCVKEHTNSSIAVLAPESGSFSTLEVHLGIRGGAFKWCIAVLIIARATCYDGGKHAIREILIGLKLAVVVCGTNAACARSVVGTNMRSIISSSLLEASGRRQHCCCWSDYCGYMLHWAASCTWVGRCGFGELRAAAAAAACVLCPGVLLVFACISPSWSCFDSMINCLILTLCQKVL